MSADLLNSSVVEVPNQSPTQVNQALASQLLPSYVSKNTEQTFAENTLDHEFVDELLSQLAQYYDKQDEELSKEGISKPLFILFGFTCMAGVLCALLDGIDGIASIVQLLPLPPILSGLIIATFALISITVFVGFDVSESAKSLGIQIDKTHETVLGRMAELKKKIKQANQYLEAAIIKADSDELPQLSKDLDKLIGLNHQLDIEIKAVDDFVANSSRANFWRKFAASACALLYLNFGFFTGQAGILYLLGNISFAAAMMNPITASLVIGGALLSAFGYTAFFYLVQCSSVENLITKHVYGIDIETLEATQSEEMTSELSTSLDLKQKQISKFQELNEQLEAQKAIPGKFSIFANRKLDVDAGTSSENDTDCKKDSVLQYHFGC